VFDLFPPGTSEPDTITDFNSFAGVGLAARGTFVGRDAAIDRAHEHHRRSQTKADLSRGGL
jgi:hypothetical protein